MERGADRKSIVRTTKAAETISKPPRDTKTREPKARSAIPRRRTSSDPIAPLAAAEPARLCPSSSLAEVARDRDSSSALVAVRPAPALHRYSRGPVSRREFQTSAITARVFADHQELLIPHIFTELVTSHEQPSTTLRKKQKNKRRTFSNRSTSFMFSM